MRARFFRVRRGLPFQQVSTGNQFAIDGAPNCIGHQPRLMRQEDNLQCQLRGIGSHVAPDTPEVAGPGNPARVNQQTRGHMRVDRKGESDQNKQRPPQWAARKNRPAGDQQQNDCRSQQAATQVIENLPTRDGRDAIGLFVSLGVTH